MLPPTIPIFPLPNAVLFPNVFMPLHIFEARYRAMVSDALAGDRIIGMVLLRPGYEREYEGRPPIYPVGCAGVITHSDRSTGVPKRASAVRYSKSSDRSALPKASPRTIRSPE